MRLNSSIYFIALAILILLFVPTTTEASEVAILKEVSGEVILTKGGGKMEFLAFNGMQVHQGDTIRTGKRSFVKIDYGNDTEMTLGEYGKIVMAELSSPSTNTFAELTILSGISGKNVTVKQESGGLWSKVKRVFGAGNSHKVETSTAIMGVRGTLFLTIVDHIKNEESVSVFDGVVGVEHAWGRSYTHTGEPKVPQSNFLLFGGVTPREAEIFDYFELLNSIDLTLALEILFDTIEEAEEQAKVVEQELEDLGRNRDKEQAKKALELGLKAELMAIVADKVFEALMNSSHPDINSRLIERRETQPQLQQRINELLGRTKQYREQIEALAKELGLTEQELQQIIADPTFLAEIIAGQNPSVPTNTNTGGGGGSSTGSGVISVTGVTLNVDSLSLPISGTSRLTATVSPSNATNAAVVWQTSNPQVATVSADGIVTAISSGTATITVTTVDGNKTASSIVTVENNDSNLVPSVGITGLAMVGETLIAIVDQGASNLTFQWKVSAELDGAYEDIIGATESTYVLSPAEIGKYILVAIQGDQVSEVLSNPVGPVSVPSNEPIEIADSWIYLPSHRYLAGHNFSFDVELFDSGNNFISNISSSEFNVSTSLPDNSPSTGNLAIVSIVETIDNWGYPVYRVTVNYDVAETININLSVAGNEIDSSALEELSIEEATSVTGMVMLPPGKTAPQGGLRVTIFSVVDDYGFGYGYGGFAQVAEKEVLIPEGENSALYDIPIIANKDNYIGYVIENYLGDEFKRQNLDLDTALFESGTYNVLINEATQIQNVVANPSNDHIELSWELDQNLGRYAVFVNGEEVFVTSNENNYTILNLVPDTEYTIRIEGYEPAHIEGWELAAVNVVTATTTNTPTLSNINIVPSSTDISLSWDSVQHADRYEVLLNDGAIITVTEPNYYISDQTPDTAYTLRVTALDNNGELLASSLIGRKTLRELTDLDINSFYQYSGIGSDYIDIKFTYGFSPLYHNFKIRYGTNGELTNEVEFEPYMAGGGYVDYKIEGLEPDTEYTISVIAYYQNDTYYSNPLAESTILITTAE